MLRDRRLNYKVELLPVLELADKFAITFLMRRKIRMSYIRLGHMRDIFVVSRPLLIKQLKIIT